MTFNFSSFHFTLLPQRATVKERIYKCVTPWMAVNLGSAFQKHLNHFTPSAAFLYLYTFGELCHLQTDAVTQLEDRSHIPLFLNNNGQAL